MATNNDVVEPSVVHAVTSLEGIHNKINGIRELYRNNSRNVEAIPMKLSEEIDHFSTEFIDIGQQFVACYGLVCDGQNNDKFAFFVMR